MARVNKKQSIKNRIGLGNLPSVQPKGLALNQGGDNVPAVIQSSDGVDIAPAALKEGEIVFSIPAIIGAGKGDYDEGAELIVAIHDKLKEIGEQMLQENSLGNV